MSNKAKAVTKKADAGKRELKPKLRFQEFRDAPGWIEEPLRQSATVISEKAGERKCVLMSITSGVGLVSQEEKFGRTIAGKSYKNYYLIRRNDFAYNKSATKEYPQGFIAMYKGDELGSVPNSIFTCFRVDEEKLKAMFLNYLFVGNHHGRWLRKYITVGARANGALSINDEDLLTLPVPRPVGKSALAEQEKIAECLSSLDELIAVHSRKLDALKAHKKGLMQQLFPREGETLPRLRFPEFKDAPEWEVKPLEDVAIYENGKAHEKDIADDGHFVVVNSKFISTEGEVRKYSDQAFCMADSGEILMVLSDVPNGRAIAKCFYVDEDNRYTVNQRICKISPTSIYGRYLFYVLDRNSFFLAFDDGVKQTNLRNDDVLNCPIRCPADPEEQERIADTVSSVDELIAAQTQKIDALETHKKGLMQQLFPSLEDAQCR